MLCDHRRCGLVKRVWKGAVGQSTQARNGWMGYASAHTHIPVVDDAVERVAVGREGDVAPRMHGPGQTRQPEAEAHYSCGFGAVQVWSATGAGVRRGWSVWDYGV